MIDYNNIPQNVNKQVFYGNPSWQIWEKPKGATMADILLIGGGGNGAAGVNGVGTIGCYGGGGGGGGSLLKMQIPFYFIPDTLYLLVGRNTENTYLSCYPNITASSLIGIASLGGNGTTGSSGPGTGGVGAVALTSTTTTNPRYLSLCNWISIGGASGTASGGLTSGGIDYNMNTQSILNGGSGGGSKAVGTGVAAYNGGAVIIADTLPQFFKSIAQSVAGAAGVAGNAPGQGFEQFRPFISYGGAGGCGGSGVAAQSGSKGMIGSGGGGGGGGNGSGSGGAGGFGLAIITSY